MPSETTIARYRDAGLKLLPPGRAFSKSPTSNIGKLFEAVGVELARAHEGAEEVLRERIPNKADVSLDAWEEALGLPGECVTNPPETIDERRGAVANKLRGRRAHDQQAYLDAAAALGYDDVEFTKYQPFAAGSSSAGDALTNDEWSWYVRADVLIGDQTADDALVCTFQHQLARAHGFVDVILEGPMGAVRTNTLYYNNADVLGADGVVADLTAIEIKYLGYVSIQCKVDNGADSDPTDAPIGVWELYASGDGTNFTRVGASDTGLADILALVAPNGNNKVDDICQIDGVPMRWLKVRYKRTSGGGGDSRVTMNVTTW